MPISDRERVLDTSRRADRTLLDDARANLRRGEETHKSFIGTARDDSPAAKMMRPDNDFRGLPESNRAAAK
jgi:hypothetical protein